MVGASRGGAAWGVCRLSARRLPIMVRWSLAAEASAVDRGEPRCAVAAWIGRTRPALLPHDPVPERLCAVRARADLVDEILLRLRDAARRQHLNQSIWSIGCGLDARWQRLAWPLAPVVTRLVELDEPHVIAAKDALLSGSPFAREWAEIEDIAMIPQGWDVLPEPDDVQPVVLLLGLLHRVPAQGLRTLLARIRRTAPRAVVVLDLTGVQGRARAGWSARRLAQLGWQVLEDDELAPRDILYDRFGDEVCAGMVPVRLLVLRAC